MHKRIKTIEESIVSMVEGQLGDLKCVDTEELGQAIDMIKDLEEALYYCSIIKAMEKAEEEDKLEEMMSLMAVRDRDMDRGMGRMYYTERRARNSQGEYMDRRDTDRDRYRERDPYMSGERSQSYEREIPTTMRDSREGRSPMSRRTYMESKELHRDKASKMKDLEKYMKELTDDIIEMIEDASPEERQVLEKKMTQLTSKVAQLNV